MNEEEWNDEWNAEALKDLILKSDPKVEPESEQFQAAMVVLAAALIGHEDRERLAELTRLPIHRVNLFGERLMAAEVWAHDGSVDCSWHKEENGDLGLWLDVLIAMGVLVSSGVGEERRYWTPAGAVN